MEPFTPIRTPLLRVQRSCATLERVLTRLARLLTDDDLETRCWAAAVPGQCGPLAIDAIQARLARTTRPAHRVRLVAPLGVIGSETAVRALRLLEAVAAGEDDPTVREAAEAAIIALSRPRPAARSPEGEPDRLTHPCLDQDGV